MKKYSYILFDLDGTLTNPYEGISKSVQFALSKFNILEEDEVRLRSMIGPPLVHSLHTYYGFDEKQSLEAVGYYREYFSQKGIYENTYYEGIYDLLSDLHREGRKLRLATSKPEIFAKKILEMFSLTGFFQSVTGSSLDGAIIEKPDIIKKAINDLTYEERNLTVMIGDRKYDILGAKANNIDSIGVLYGFGSYDELQTSNADFIARNIQELKEILISELN